MKKEKFGIVLDFKGSCGKGCYATLGLDGSLIFGSGNLNEDFSWEKPCNVCTKAWRQEHKYLFDLAVITQALLIIDNPNVDFISDERLYFDYDQLQEIKNVSKLINFLNPFEKFIRTVISVVSHIGVWFIKLDDLSHKYIHKLPRA